MSRNPEVILAGTMTVTTSAAVIDGLPGDVFDVILQNHPDSGNDIYVGNATIQPIILEAGQPFAWDIGAANGLYVKTSTTTAILNWLAKRHS